jgi:hypothetical protein
MGSGTAKTARESVKSPDDPATIGRALSLERFSRLQRVRQQPPAVSTHPGDLDGSSAIQSLPRSLTANGEKDTLICTICALANSSRLFSSSASAGSSYGKDPKYESIKKEEVGTYSE